MLNRQGFNKIDILIDTFSTKLFHRHTVIFNRPFNLDYFLCRICVHVFWYQTCAIWCIPWIALIINKLNFRWLVCNRRIILQKSDHILHANCPILLLYINKAAIGFRILNAYLLLKEIRWLLNHNFGFVVILCHTKICLIKNTLFDMKRKTCSL